MTNRHLFGDWLAALNSRRWLASRRRLSVIGQKICTIGWTQTNTVQHINGNMVIWNSSYHRIMYRLSMYWSPFSVIAKKNKQTCKDIKNQSHQNRHHNFSRAAKLKNVLKTFSKREHVTFEVIYLVIRAVISVKRYECNVNTTYTRPESFQPTSPHKDTNSFTFHAIYKASSKSIQRDGLDGWLEALANGCGQGKVGLDAVLAPALLVQIALVRTAHLDFDLKVWKK